MTFNSLNAIVTDILLELRNSNIAESEHISRIQIEQWVHSYRAMLIKQDLDKGRDVNPQYVQTYGPLHVSKTEPIPNSYDYVTDVKIPNTIDLHYDTGLLTVKDVYGNLIQIGHETKARWQINRKYTCNDYIAYLKDGRIHLIGPDYLEWIQIEGIFEDPTSLGDCFDYDNKPYPVPANMIPVIKQLIFANELNVMMQVNTDTTNDAEDDNLTQNSVVRRGTNRNIGL